MHKIEIIKEEGMSNKKAKKERYFAHFEDDSLAKAMFDSIKENNEIKSENKNSITYLDRKTQTIAKAKLKNCKNANGPKLKENEVWIKLYAHKATYRESMIITFKNYEDYKEYIDKHIIKNSYKALTLINENLIHYMTNTGEIIYATAFEQKGDK